MKLLAFNDQIDIFNKHVHHASFYPQIQNGIFPNPNPPYKVEVLKIANYIWYTYINVTAYKHTIIVLFT